MPTLTGIDVIGVQRYVFGSSRLRDAVAASSIVHWATACDGALALPESGSVLLASGGNAILKFTDLDQARNFIAQYTRRLYDQAPGLEVAIAHREYKPGNLASALKCLQIDLARAKFERTPSVPQLGLSVTMPCRITGLPAVDFDPLERVPVSHGILRLRDPSVLGNALLRWGKFLKDRSAFDFPSDLDHLGRSSGDTSLIGIVHIDGNDVGQSISAWLKQCAEHGLDDDTVERQYREWSNAIDDSGQRAIEAVVKRIIEAIDKKEARLSGALADLGFKLRDHDGRLYLPLRPVLLGGDDLTFICDGRIALDLATTALDVFARKIPHLENISASAGVAIVRSHAPFERNYELAENLCANAKRRRQEKNDAGSWIDWHIGPSSPSESIASLRERAYVRKLGNRTFELTCRPYRLGSSASQTETWRWLSQEVLGTGENGFRGRRWRDHRNKLKQFASLVREGPDGIGRARAAWTAASNIELPGGLNDENGFLAARTPLLDAIELLDLYLPLDKGKSS